MSNKTLIQFLNKERILTRFKKNLVKLNPDLCKELNFPPLNSITYVNLEKLTSKFKWSDEIIMSFIWTKSPEGIAYWDYIDTKYRDYLSN